MEIEKSLQQVGMTIRSALRKLDHLEQLFDYLKQEFPQMYGRVRFPDSSGIGLKPVSSEGSERLIRAAIRYAIAQKRKSVTFVHKGNIMKFTEGAFRNWVMLWRLVNFQMKLILGINGKLHVRRRETMQQILSRRKHLLLVVFSSRMQLQILLCNSC